ncbi:MAG: hypothetical protein AB1689_02725 [Thermodesulfobacteriota bacterium]
MQQTTTESTRAASRRRWTAAVRLPVPGMALMLLLALPARAASFLEQVERGRAAVRASATAASGDAAARAAALDEAVRTGGGGSAAFALGASLAALDLDLEGDPASTRRGDRAAVERQVRTLLRAQAESGIGNRALCLLSGRSNPRSLEAQVRLVEPRWTCGSKEHDH